MIAWKSKKAVPTRSSPILVDDLIYFVADNGVVVFAYRHPMVHGLGGRIDGTYSVAPIYANGRLYFFNESGKATILASGRQLKVLAENQLGDGFMGGLHRLGRRPLSTLQIGGSIASKPSSRWLRPRDPKFVAIAAGGPDDWGFLSTRVPCPTLAWACLFGCVSPCPQVQPHAHASVRHGTRATRSDAPYRQQFVLPGRCCYLLGRGLRERSFRYATTRFKLGTPRTLRPRIYHLLYDGRSAAPHRRFIKFPSARR